MRQQPAEKVDMHRTSVLCILIPPSCLVYALPLIQQVQYHQKLDAPPSQNKQNNHRKQKRKTMFCFFSEPRILVEFEGLLRSFGRFLLALTVAAKFHHGKPPIQNFQQE